MKKYFIALCFILASCTKTVAPTTEPSLDANSVKLDVIGSVEPIYLLPIKSPFKSRIDTGAQTSSIDAHNIKRFERDGEHWVSFEVINDTSLEKHYFEKKVERLILITRTNKDEKRIVVNMDVKFANKIFKQEFSLNDREKFEYQVLIGRNILKGNFVVDVSVDNTYY